MSFGEDIEDNWGKYALAIGIGYLLGDKELMDKLKGKVRELTQNLSEENKQKKKVRK